MSEQSQASDESPEVPQLPTREVADPTVVLIPIEQIAELENVRPFHEMGDIEELAESVRVRGLLHPVRLRPAPADAEHGKQYELVLGYRRLAAARLLKKTEIPAIVHTATDEELLADMVTENLQRKNLSAIAEARAMQRMIDTFGWTQGQVAAHLSVHRTQVVKRLQLLRLPEKVKAQMDEGLLTASHAEVIARLETEEEQVELAELAVRTQASVAKLNAYATRIKEKQDAEAVTAQPTPDADLPLTPHFPDAGVTPLPGLALRDGLTAEDHARMQLFVLLRASNDLEMTQFLAEHFDVDRDDHWYWIGALSDAQVAALSQTLTVRWLQAAHRRPTLPADLISDLGAGERPVDSPRTPTAQEGTDGLPALPDGDDDEELYDDELDFGEDEF